MNLSCRVVKSMSLPGSSVTRKSGGGSNFPAGLRVLVVDDDPTCLAILQKMLQTCGYEVTKTNRAEVALTLLRENRNDFDIVISDVHMPDMDGFKLLERVGLEMDLPVIMMSADDTKTVVMKGVTHGACDYLIKPIRIEALKNIWQHVVRKKKNEWKDLEQSGSWGEVQRQDDAVSSPTSEDGWKSSKRSGEEEESEDKDDSAALKKPRVVWGVELHQQFVAAVNQLGIDKAVPKRILELMNVSGLSRENVASHLQKFRLGLRRANGVFQNQGGLNNSSIPQDSGFPAMSSLGGLDLQGLTAPTQFSAQTLAAYSQMPSTVVNAGMSMPFVDQRNLFSSENSKLAYGNGQQVAQLGNVGKQVNLLHGVSKIMEPEQIGAFNQSGKNLGGMNMHASSLGSHQTLGRTKKPASSSGSHQTLGGMNMHASSSGSHQSLGGMNMHASSSGSHQALGGMNMHASSSGSHQALGGMNLHTSSSSGHQSNSLLMPMIPQQQSSGKILNESQAPLVQSSMGVPPMQSSAVISRNRMAYNPVSQAAAPLVDLSVNRISELPGSGFPLGSTPCVTSMTSNGFLNQEEVCSNIKGTRGYSPNYGVFSELQQRKYQDWQSQNSGMNLGSCSSQHGTCSVNVAPSVLLNQSYVNNQKNEQNVNSFIGKQMFSGVLENQQMGTMNPNPNLNGPRLVGNPITVKTDIEANLFSEQYGQEDLMSALLKQQEGMSSGEFDFDGYTLDNIPV